MDIARAFNSVSELAFSPLSALRLILVYKFDMAAGSSTFRCGRSVWNCFRTLQGPLLQMSHMTSVHGRPKMSGLSRRSSSATRLPRGFGVGQKRKHASPGERPCPRYDISCRPRHLDHELDLFRFKYLLARRLRDLVGLPSAFLTSRVRIDFLPPPLGRAAAS